MINLQNLCHAYGEQSLLQGVTWQLPDSQCWCLVGRNGAGKSTLLKILAKQILPDEGEVQYRGTSRVAYVPQSLPEDDGSTVKQYILKSIPQYGQLLFEYDQAIESGDMDLMSDKQLLIDQYDLWHWLNALEQVLTQLKLDGALTVDSLSGGWKKRVSIACALVLDPDVLLLDEPTNHLDVGSIVWLEEICRNFKGSVLFISHDRTFIEHIARGVVELDRGLLHPYDLKTSQSLWHDFVEAREKRIQDEETQTKLFNKRLAQEEVWIRQGIKARRTRNEGRVRRLEQLRRDKKALRSQTGQATMHSAEMRNSGKLVVDIENLDVYGGDKLLVRDFSAIVQRGDCIALVGDNGVGKTSLLNAIFEQTPDEVKLGTNIDLGSLDQYRNIPDETMTAVDFVGEGREFIDLDNRQTHVISYLQDFLFTPERAKKPISVLSGGERNRLMLAYMFSKPANVLVLDEPTNDLDIDTLDVLEEKLSEFKGTLFLVSHDRMFVDHLATQIWGFTGDQSITTVVGVYEDWQRWLNSYQTQKTAKLSKTNMQEATTLAKQEKSNIKVANKLSYKLQRELDQLPEQMDVLELAIAQLEEIVSDKDFYTQEQGFVQSKLQELDKKQLELENKMERWIDLTEQSGD